MPLLGTTKSGAPCKLCKKKNNLCHLHKSTPKKSRCWVGYEPVPGKKAYSKGSCRKIG